MQKPQYYVGLVYGFFVGYFTGVRSAQKFLKLNEQYGGIQHIPTRDLEKLGRSAGMFVGRQRIMLAAIALRHLTSKYVNNELPHTINVVANYLDFKDIGPASQSRMVSIAASTSVVHALATYASTYDALDIPELHKAMMAQQHLHLWHMFEDNVMLRVN
ncbi:hypothetical protein D3C87_364620 [compost metagenome]